MRRLFGRNRRRRPLWTSPLARRILAMNVLTLAIPVLGLLYLDNYRDTLVRAELDLLMSQGRLIAGALASTSALGPDAEGEYRLVPEWTRHSLRQIAGDFKMRARVFTAEGMLADTLRMHELSGAVKVEPLPPVDRQRPISDRIFGPLYDVIIDWLPTSHHYPLYEEQHPGSQDFPEVLASLNGYGASQVRDSGSGKLILSVAVPIQRYRQVLGSLLLSQSAENVAATLRETRIRILAFFAIALGVTILLSLYLSSRIAWPLARLAFAADRVRTAAGRKVQIPDLSARHDEIGDLSLALREMTEALSARMAATERFAADVAHEIKNPLTSLRSAVETVARIEDPVQQRKLMSIILDDVARLNRLITDISDASRIDAEMARDEMMPVNLTQLINTLADILLTTGTAIDLELPEQPVIVMGLEGRLGQVLRNLTGNAQTFSPPGGHIRIVTETDGPLARLKIEDQGPGIPPGKLEKIFERFYSERPEGEKFGTHSGLGLSISRQIVEAHGGKLYAENILNAQGRIAGARFVLELPMQERS
ncbi:MAG TPA: stimulus-sensing domain-containing protein [Dongiaceae bacterium]|jgi:two-component system sensor histidine kinase ChvG|nr:stimulus-sensing domain-containing protein [Dongiaceae bacterium]